MSINNVPKIEAACNELTLLKQQHSVSAYLQENSIRKAIIKAMDSSENWQKLYKLLAPNCCSTVRQLIKQNKYNLPTERKDELINGATYNISQDLVRKIGFRIDDSSTRIVEGFALLIINQKLQLTILTRPIKKTLNYNGSKRQKKD